MSGSLYELDDYGENVVLQWRNLILPVVLGIRPLAVISQLMHQ
jgi:peptide/nickel transport system permease protein